MAHIPLAVFVGCCILLVTAAKAGNVDAAQRAKLWEVPFIGELAIDPLRAASDVVVAASDAEVFAVNTSTGKRMWNVTRFTATRKSQSFMMKPFVQDRLFCFAATGSVVVVLEVATGSVRWHKPAGQFVAGYAGYGVLILTSVTYGSGFTTVLTAVHLGSGREYTSNTMHGAMTVSSPDTDIVVTMGRVGNENRTDMVAVRASNTTNGFVHVYKVSLPHLFASEMAFAGPTLLAGVMLDYDGNNIVTTFEASTGAMLFTDHGSLRLGGFLGFNGTVGFYAGTDYNTTAIEMLTGHILWSIAYQPIYEHFFTVTLVDGSLLAYIGPPPQAQTLFPLSVYSQRDGRLQQYLQLPYPGVGVRHGDNATPLLTNSLPSGPVLFFLTSNSVTAIRADGSGRVLWEDLNVYMPYGMVLHGSRLVLAYGPSRQSGFIASYDVSTL
jgi:outer membrane protein assembly factor BamB